VSISTKQVFFFFFWSSRGKIGGEGLAISREKVRRGHHRTFKKNGVSAVVSRKKRKMAEIFWGGGETWGKTGKTIKGGVGVGETPECTFASGTKGNSRLLNRSQVVADAGKCQEEGTVQKNEHRLHHRREEAHRKGVNEWERNSRGQFLPGENAGPWKFHSGGQ